MDNLIHKVQINIPFKMLYNEYIETFVSNGLNPEIGLDAQALDNFTMADFEAVAGCIRDARLSVTFHAPFMDLSPGSPDPMAREITRNRFGQMLSLIPAFCPKSVVFHTGYDRKRYWHMREEWIENSIEIWSWVGEALKNLNIIFAIENVYEDDPDDILVFLKKLRHLGVKFCLDTGHQSAFSELPLTHWLRSLGPYIGQLHLHDNNGSEDEHLALGRGQIDFRILFDYLAQSTAGPPLVTLEPHKEEDLFPSLNYLEKLWPW